MSTIPFSGAHSRTNCGTDKGISHVADQGEHRGGRIHEQGLEQTVASRVPQIKANIKEVFQPGPGDRIHDAFLRQQIKAKIVELEALMLRAADQGENRRGVSGSDSGAHPRAHLTAFH